MERGRYTWLEGLDGVGKGVQQEAILKFEKNKGKIKFSSQTSDTLEDYAKKFENEDKQFLMNFNHNKYILDTVEPTYWGIGKAIREELTSNNGRSYSSHDQIQAYSLDRLVHMKRVVIPFLENGHDVVQSRSMVSTLCYQTLKGLGEGRTRSGVREDVLKQEGNKLALRYAPNLVIISTIDNISELMKRLSEREKNDNCEFEKLQFQSSLAEFYEEPWLKWFLEDNGISVAYLDAGKTKEETERQALEIYSDFYDKGMIKEKYSMPKTSEVSNIL